MSAEATSASRSRAGTVALIGWTNVGKSTLLNRLVGEKVAAVAEVAQTTRHTIRGISNVAGRGQIVFIDTPGLHRPKYRMNQGMVDQLRSVVHGVDVVALMADASRGLGPGDRQAAELLREVACVRLTVLNKVDLVRPKTRLLPMIEAAVSELGIAEVLPLSAKTGEGCSALVDRLLELLPSSEPLYPVDYFTDQSERELAAEWIREKILALTRQELPHATAVLVERWEEREDGLLEVEATVFVERDSQKQIVIGRGGSLLREVGRAARLELEQLLGRRIFLSLWVRTRRDWRNDPRVLRRLGLG